MTDAKVNDQVIVRKKIRSGILIRHGSIVRLDGDKALVSFPTDYCQAVLPVAGLERTSTKYSIYARVQPTAIRRSM